MTKRFLLVLALLSLIASGCIIVNVEKGTEKTLDKNASTNNPTALR